MDFVFRCFGVSIFPFATGLLHFLQPTENMSGSSYGLYILYIFTIFFLLFFIRCSVGLVLAWKVSKKQLGLKRPSQLNNFQIKIKTNSDIDSKRRRGERWLNSQPTPSMTVQIVVYLLLLWELKLLSPPLLWWIFLSVWLLKVGAKWQLQKDVLPPLNSDALLTWSAGLLC